jgi:hypothetical protein
VKDDRHIVLPLLGVAVFSLMFLFSVTATRASFTGQENPFPEVISMKKIFPPMDAATTQIAVQMRWALKLPLDGVKKPVLSFLGLSDYKFGQVRHSAVHTVSAVVYPKAAQTSVVAVSSIETGVAKPSVLGAHTVNPEYEYQGFFTTLW